jgi:hypothetical protein
MDCLCLQQCVQQCMQQWRLKLFRVFCRTLSSGVQECSEQQLDAICAALEKVLATQHGGSLLSPPTHQLFLSYSSAVLVKLAFKLLSSLLGHHGIKT